VSVEHYENFPVASWLCPPTLRATVQAIYWFARTADDLADEGERPAAARLQDLAAYRGELQRAFEPGDSRGGRWPQVFGPLAGAIRRHALPPGPMFDLLSAFEQDVGNPSYADRAELLDYCRRSANPVGRLLLHLYGVGDALAVERSDAVCTALQLINFWQDLGVDAARGRHYVPLADARRHGVTHADLQARRDGPAARALVRDLCDWAGALMLDGAPLVHQLPGRAGWELRLVVQGGLRVLQRIERDGWATLRRRPKLGAADALPLLWQAATMRSTLPPARTAA
jgi:squalene synthase HpnC